MHVKNVCRTSGSSGKREWRNHRRGNLCSRSDSNKTSCLELCVPITWNRREFRMIKFGRKLCLFIFFNSHLFLLLFIYFTFCLWRIFVDARGLSLVVEVGDCPSLFRAGFLLSCGDFSCCGTQAAGLQVSAVAVRGFSS